MIHKSPVLNLAQLDAELSRIKKDFGSEKIYVGVAKSGNWSASHVRIRVESSPWDVSLGIPLVGTEHLEIKDCSVDQVTVWFDQNLTPVQDNHDVKGDPIEAWSL